MNAAEYLARVGWDHVLTYWESGTTPFPTEEKTAELDAFVTEYLLRFVPTDRPGKKKGSSWGIEITWPDRIPDLVTWSGQATLTKIIRKHQQAMSTSPESPEKNAELIPAKGISPLAYKHPLKGVSGIDSLSVINPLDAGFSPDALGMKISQRPGVELLAIIGAEIVPMISYGKRVCGFFHDGCLWKFPVLRRESKYLYQWGDICKGGDMRFYGSREVSNELGVSVATISRHASSGSIGQRTGRDLIFSRHDIDLLEKSIEDSPVGNPNFGSDKK